MFSKWTVDSIKYVIVTTLIIIRISIVGMAPSITLMCNLQYKQHSTILELLSQYIPVHKESFVERVYCMSWKCSCHLTLSETSTVAHNYHRNVSLEEMLPT